jgi:hypothetical protein
MNRELPILDADGELRGRAGLWTWCYMSFSENEQDAIRAGNCLYDENDCIDLGMQDGYREVGLVVQKLMTRRMTQARISGQVFWQMVLNCQNRGEPDFRKAVFSIAEWASITKTENGRQLPASGDNLRKEQFPRFRSAMYFWVAFDLMDVADQRTVFAGGDDESSFLKFLAAASEIQRVSESLDLQNKTPALENWDPWVVPKVMRTALHETMTIRFPDEPELIKSV